MNLYRIQYTRTINRITRDIVLFIDAANDSEAIEEADRRFPDGCTRKKLYKIGIEIAL